MHVNTYKKHMVNILDNNINFAKTRLAQLEMDVMGYLTMAITCYERDGNINHAKAAAILTEGFNARWTAPVFKAIKKSRGLHTDLKIAVGNDNMVAFSYQKIAKDKRPDTLPAVQSVIDEMLSEFLQGKRSRDPMTDEEKAENYISATMTRIMKPGQFVKVAERCTRDQLAYMYEAIANEMDARSPKAVPEAKPEPEVADNSPATDDADEPVPATEQEINLLIEALAA